MLPRPARVVACLALGALVGAETPPVTRAPQVLCAFDGPADLALWRVRSGPRPEIVAEPRTEGLGAAKVRPSTLLVWDRPPPDWSGYATLAFDVRNPSPLPRQIEVVIGDAAWQADPDYWNRHNSLHALPPGAHTVEIPLGNLYRGEAAARNRGSLPRNLDLHQITYLSLHCHGRAAEEAVVLDHLRLLPPEPPPPSPREPGPRGFDFGPADQPLWPGFLPVTWNTVYAPETGYGLTEAQPRPTYALDTGWPNRLLQDALWMARGAFRVEVPDGLYDVWVWFEDAGYWPDEQARHARREIRANGVVVWAEDRGPGRGREEYLHRFEDAEPGPQLDLVEVAFDRLHRPRVFRTTTRDGRIDFTFSADARQAARVAGLALLPADDPASVTWREALEANLRREARARFTRRPDTVHPPVGGGLEAERVRIFGWSGDAPPGPSAVPAASPRLTELSGVAAGGETALLRLGLHAREGLTGLSLVGGPLRSEHGDVLPKELITARVGRFLAQRVAGEPVYRVQPGLLIDAVAVDLPAGVTRAAWITVDVPPDASPGRYTGELSLRAEGWSASLPISLQVRPFTLDPPDLALAAFGMPEDALSTFAAYGFTAVSGGPRITWAGWDAAGQPRLGTAATAAYLARARALGLHRGLLDYAGPLALEGLRGESVEGYFTRLGEEAGLTAGEAARRIFAHLHEVAADWGPWHLNLVDEPLHREQVDTLLQGIAFLREHARGVRLGGFFSYSPARDPLGLARLFDALEVIVTKDIDEPRLRAARAGGKTVYLYSRGRTRHAAGFGLYRPRGLGVAGYLEWHASILHGYQFLDFDGREPDTRLLYETRAGWRPSVELENLRQGIVDLRYAITLENLLARARAAGRDDAAVHAAAVALNELPPPPGTDAEVVRARLAQRIEALRFPVAPGVP
jgi:hypothetical protein